jgi:dipeptidyl aminopeptidase/acylaminoacyl peptidase
MKAFVYVLSVAALVVLVVASAIPSNAAFPGVNGKIAFARALDIWVMEPGVPGATQLTIDAAADLTPRWSPDGTMIAFKTDRDGNDEIYVMNANGALPANPNLTGNPARDASPAWSPDGTRIAFVSNRDGNNEIYVMDATGLNPIRITNDAAEDRDPAWSPDGTTIAFVSDRAAGGVRQIFVTSPSGTNINTVQWTSTGGNKGVPTWSPDGTKLAFDQANDIWFMDAAPNGAATNVTKNALGNFGPAWSPDGTLIAFATTRHVVNADNNTEIYITTLDGATQTRLTNDLGADEEPDWQTLPPPPPPTVTPTPGAKLYAPVIFR